MFINNTVYANIFASSVAVLAANPSVEKVTIAENTVRFPQEADCISTSTNTTNNSVLMETSTSINFFVRGAHNSAPIKYELLILAQTKNADTQHRPKNYASGHSNLDQHLIFAKVMREGNKTSIELELDTKTHHAGTADQFLELLQQDFAE